MLRAVSPLADHREWELSLGASGTVSQRTRSIDPSALTVAGTGINQRRAAEGRCDASAAIV
jgi:hypothetical protein